MQLGQIVDYCIEVENQEYKAEKKETKKRKATQADINSFFGPPRSKHG